MIAPADCSICCPAGWSLNIDQVPDEDCPVHGRVADLHGAEERRPCPHGCAGGHTEAEYYGGDCPRRVGEAFEGWGPGL